MRFRETGSNTGRISGRSDTGRQVSARSFGDDRAPRGEVHKLDGNLAPFEARERQRAEAAERRALTDGRLIVTSPAGAAQDRVNWLFRRSLTSARFSKNLAVVAGNNNHVDQHSRYSVSKVRIDTKSFERSLGSTAKNALRDFVKQPGSRSACRRFQESLPDESLQRSGKTIREYKAAPTVSTSIVNCDIAVVGDGNRNVMKTDRRAAIGELKLDQLMRRDEKLAMAFASHLAHSEDAQLLSKFNDQVVESMSQDVLKPLLETADFGDRPTSITGFGGAANMKNAELAMVGIGNTARSVVEIRVHKVTPIEAGKLESLAARVTPQTQGAASPNLLPRKTIPSSGTKPSQGSRTSSAAELWAEQMRARSRRKRENDQRQNEQHRQRGRSEGR